ncbi:MAG: ubiquitin-like small modifier protein 1 [Candidatus Methylomirabilales bacterium]
MATIEVHVPQILRKHTGGAKTLKASGQTVREVLEDLERQHPGFRERVLEDGGRLHRFVNIYVNDEDVRFIQTLDTPLKDGDVLSILPAVAGGQA